MRFGPSWRGRVPPTAAAVLAAAVGFGLLPGFGAVAATGVSAMASDGIRTGIALSDAPAAQPPAAQPPAAEPVGASRQDTTAERPVPGVWLSIPAIGVHDLRLVAYRGQADDLAGTRIEDRGLAASPRGPLGGVAPGTVGNLIVTAHRTSAGGPLRRLPMLRDGDHILVSADGLVYDYVVTGTMTISFRSKASLALQSAAVPGYPGQAATRAMVTLSTCATPEDHAAGNHWADALGNPEHRIDKIGVLVATRTA